jgi:uroporphyrinogen decarboxylase
MTSRQRVLAVLNRQEVDRLPVDLWCTPEVLDALKAHAGTADELQAYRRLGVDKIVWVSPVYRRPGEANRERTVSTWGVPLQEIQAGAATYREFAGAPLAGVESPEQVHKYPDWPNPGYFDYAEAAGRAQRAGGEFVTLGPWISLFEIYCTLRGLEQSMMDLLEQPELADTVLDRIEQCQTEMLTRYFAAAGDALDMVFVSDDIGTQAGLLLSPQMWQRFLAPRLTRWCELIHAHGAKVFYHSDGAIAPLIGRLIDCGIDVLNPIQHACPGMDLAALKRNFGDRVIFHGGVDNQRILPFGSPAEVREETLRCLSTLGEGGNGYICCSCHNIQAGTPLQNILTMIQTVQGVAVGA